MLFYYTVYLRHNKIEWTDKLEVEIFIQIYFVFSISRLPGIEMNLGKLKISAVVFHVTYGTEYLTLQS